MHTLLSEELIANRTARLQHFGVSVSGVVSYSIELQDTSCGKVRKYVNDCFIFF